MQYYLANTRRALSLSSPSKHRTCPTHIALRASSTSSVASVAVGLECSRHHGASSSPRNSILIGLDRFLTTVRPLQYKQMVLARIQLKISENEEEITML
jgi:hypothetical protein